VHTLYVTSGSGSNAVSVKVKLVATFKKGEAPADGRFKPQMTVQDFGKALEKASESEKLKENTEEFVELCSKPLVQTIKMAGVLGKRDQKTAHNFGKSLMGAFMTQVRMV
jgi:hypothetical protein